jgi:hypothetical protein
MALILSSALSTREGISTGTFASTTTWADAEPAKYLTALPSRLPASIHGTTMQSAWPATGWRMPLASAAERSSALSSASGPNTSASPSAPSCPIAVSAARPTSRASPPAPRVGTQPK